MGTVRTRRDPPPTVEIPRAEYVCQVKKIDPDVETTFGKKDRVTVEIVEGPLTGQTANKLFGQSLGTQSKMYSFLTTVGVPPVQDGQSFDLNVLLGRRAVVLISPNKDDEGKVYNNIESWRPYFQGAVPPPVAPPPPPMAGPGVAPQMPAAYPPGYVPPTAPPPVAPLPPVAPPPVTGTRPNFV